MHKVGEITDFGKLVAESLIWDKPTQTVAMYEIAAENILNDDDPAYVIIIWDITDISRDFEISREYHQNDEYAMASFLDTAYNISL